MRSQPGGPRLAQRGQVIAQLGRVGPMTVTSI
jgi:hypothetical protein